MWQLIHVDTDTDSDKQRWSVCHWPLAQALKVLPVLLAQRDASSEAGLIYVSSKPGSSDPTQKTCIYKDVDN